MDRRTKLLILITAVAAGAFIFDKAFSAFWWDPWQKLKQDIGRADFDIRRAKDTLAKEKNVREDWSQVRAKLDKPRVPDVHTHFVTHMGDICDKVGVSFDITGNPQPQQQGDFKEYVYETKFKLTWAQFVDLLGELHKSKEFLKPLRISVGSQYEKEDRLDLELKVSTIEFAPPPSKPGVK